MGHRIIWCAALGAAAALLTTALHSAPRPEADNPAEKIAYYGHGRLLDSAMKEIKLAEPLLSQMQEAMLAEALKSPGKSDANTQAAMKQAQELIASGRLAANELVLLRAGVVKSALINAEQTLVKRLKWRNEAMFLKYWNQDLKVQVLPDHIRELLRQLHLFDLPNAGTPTAYMDNCRAQGVPIPPDWSETSTRWKLQGSLGLNILQPGVYAGVWTYSDPATRGACIALPRGSGGAGSLAGIICQSATTGHACFWDNQLKTAPWNVLGWSGVKLVISELVDGSDMDDAKRCTDCHRGNNVYLMSPDDATWAKVLRGPLDGGSTGTFTTRVESSSDNTGGHARYIPIAKPGWVNTFTANCGSACHEMPTVTRPAALTMPPACASGSPATDPAANCYGSP
jgi:hypothetical protein